MNKFVLWFTKLTAIIPEYIYFRRKTYYINKKSQKRKIKGSAIIISNHTSVYDVALYLFTFFNRSIHFLVGEVMYQRSSLFSWFINCLGGIKVDRNSFDFGFMTEAINVLNKGGVVEIYPEGRLPRPGENELLEFKPSFVYIALETNTPIIPVYTNGNYGKKTRARIMIGEKIYLSELVDHTKSEQENIQYLCDYVRDYIKLLGVKLDECQKEKTKIQ